ncbi:uncharacterized protein [Argopecten irradians]|uniref:uncharacterized protein n=1 Tax=Argopecten irradians TaxID=31199 RepID=UPI00371231AB
MEKFTLVLSLILPILSVAMAQRKFVEVHNAYRAKESAKNMQEMTWVGAIKRNAYKVAKKCVWEHSSSDDRKITWRGQTTPTVVGENLMYTTGNQKLNVTKVLDLWYREKKDYNFRDNSCQDGKVCGHYKQVVWADSTKLGCSSVNCEPFYEIKNGAKVVKKPSATFVVCQYGPAGNIKGKKPYKKGKPCTACPMGTSCGQNDPVELCSVQMTKKQLLLDFLYQIQDMEEDSSDGV